MNQVIMHENLQYENFRRDKYIMRKEKNISKFLKFAVIAFLAVMIFPASNVKADRVIEIEKNNFKKTVVLSAYDKIVGDTFCFKGVSAEIIKVESSNKSVATVKKSQYNFLLMPKKLGTTKITVTALIGNKKVKRSGTVRIVKFQNPFQALKINGKNYSSKLNASYNSIQIKTKKSTNKLNFKLKPGWEIDYNYYYMGREALNYALKNGQKFTLKKGESLYIFLEVKNKKSGLNTGTFLTIQR